LNLQRNPVLVALDVPTLPEALRLVALLRDRVGGFKVGLELCTAVGVPQVIDAIGAEGGRVFVDLKFKDIPNTVAGAARGLARPEVLMFNIHADGGVAMMHAAAAAVAGSDPRPLVLGVTVLTSINQAMLNDEIGISGPVAKTVVRLARLAQSAGLDGVVGSAREVAAIRAACGPDFVTVVPGTRPAWAEANDQQRIATPAEAIRAGATYLVVGRAITHPPASVGGPAAAAQRIADEIAPALNESASGKTPYGS
jgi:orotidine-5'-phosphate decarboxylase